MRSPGLNPAAELRRLSSLYRYDILDTPAEDVFDQVVRIAARLFNCDRAALGFADHDRLWIKASVGCNQTAVARDKTFCSYTIQGYAPFFVEDALNDPRFRNSPVIHDNSQIRMYVGIPIVADDGSIIGSLCVMDNKPRLLGPYEIDLMLMLGQQINMLLDQRLVHLKQLKLNKALWDSLQSIRPRDWVCEMPVAAADHPPIAYWHTDASGRIVFSDSVYAFLGLDPNTGPVTPASYQQRVHPDDAASIRKNLDTTSTQPVQTFCYRILRHDGAYLPVCETVLTHRVGDAQPITLGGIISLAAGEGTNWG